MTSNKEKTKVALVSNTTWSIYNYRIPLIDDLQKNGCEVICISPKDDYVKEINDKVQQYIDIDLHRRAINPVNELFTLYQLEEIYKSEKPDFVCHFTIKPVIYGTIAARLAKVKDVINMVTGRGYVFGKNSLFARILRIPVKILYKNILKFARLNIFQNPEDRNYFSRENLVDKKKSVVSYGSGVDIEYFSYSEPVPKKNCSFLFLGRLLYDKGVQELVEAATKLKNSHPHIQVNILGMLDEKNPSGISKSTIDKWKNKKELNFLERRDDVRSVIADNDVIVLPSYYREGVPRSLLEAMAMGRPIITTDWPGCRETVIDGKNGKLVPIKKVKELFNAMKYMAENPAKRVEMGKKSRDIAAQKFDVKRVNKIFLESMNLI